MIENHRSELVWKTMRRNPYIVRGLEARGVHGRMARRARALTALAAGLGLGVLAAAGCARDAAASGGAQVLRFWGLGREGEVVKELVPEFERENPGIRRRRAADPVDRRAREAPDGASWAARRPTSRSSATRGSRSSPRSARSSRSDARVAPRRMRLRPPTTTRASGRRTGSTGRLYGIPWYVDTRVLFYRRDLLKAAGYSEMPPDVVRAGARRCEDPRRAGGPALRDPPSHQRVGADHDLRPPGALAAARGRRDARRLRAARLRPRGRLVRLAVQGGARAGRRAIRSSEIRTRSSAADTSPCGSRARGTSASSDADCRQSSRIPG